MKITRQPVTSSQLKSVGYSATEKLLDIEFQPRKGKTEGDVYRYSQFTQEDMNAFLGAESLRSYFIKTIKPNPTRWPFRRLTEEEAE